MVDVDIETTGQVPEKLSDWLLNLFVILLDLFIANVNGIVTIGALFLLSRLGRYILSLILAIFIFLIN